MINLSEQGFSTNEYKLLGYNLNFVPTPNKINKNELLQDIKNFNRRIKLKSHFGSIPKEGLYFKSNSTWEPQNTHHTVKTFTEDFSRRVMEKINNGNNQRIADRKNLTKLEMQAMEDLQKREDLVITKADKGGAVVVQDVQNYIKEADRQLSDKKFYKILDHNPTSENAALVENAIDSLKQRGLLDEKMAEKLKPVEPKTPRFYLLPKIHKPNNPGRPVVSSINCHTERISQYVDSHLQPLNKALPTYVQDSTDFIKKLENLPEELPNDAILVTLDVGSLYTNIPNEEGIEAVKSYFRARAAPNDNVLSKVIATFLTLILTLNNFVFNDKNYVQTNGASMGTKCAPTYASLFMGRFEETHILPRIRAFTLLYIRYIDDLFMIWKGSEKELLKFLKEINEVHPTIKFEYKYSRKKVDFLDTAVSFSGRKLKTTLYTKPTDRKAYLHGKSYHPKSTKEAIAYSQATRLRRICTEKEDFEIHAKKLMNDLTNRGYRKEKVSEDINRAGNRDRETLLMYKEKSPNDQTPLIVTYHRNLPNLKEIVDQTWGHLQINPLEKVKFNKKPVICFRRNRNLRDILGQTKISRNKVVRKRPPIKGRCAPCRSRADTKCCNHIISTTHFTNKTGSKRYDIRHKTGCKSRNALYLSFCIKCNEKQYVGKVEMQGANKRINKHRNDAKRSDSIGIDKHFLEPGHNFDRDFRMIVIEEISSRNMTKEQTRQTLLRREDFWIKQLDTLEPNGFNDRLNFPEA